MRSWSLVVVMPLLGCGLSTLELDGPDGTSSTKAPPATTSTPIYSGECEGPISEPCTTKCGTTGTRTCDGTNWGECTMAELCENGIDDDCDGRPDRADPECPPITHTCEETEGHNCNGDLGYGDHCAPQDNTNGCSAARFHAWCNRRNPELPDIWESWIRSWIDSRCDGAMSSRGTQYVTYSCLDSSNNVFECTTPLVLQFTDAPVRFDVGPGTFEFTPGERVVTDWPAADSPWLVRDLDGDGRITSGRELFGSDTSLRGGRLARHGFEALAALDDNGDGAVDARDSAFGALKTWRDRNRDRVAQRDELRTLAEEGVTSLRTAFRVVPRCDARGNCERERGTFTWRGTGVVVDVYLRIASWPAARVDRGASLELACR